MGIAPRTAVIALAAAIPAGILGFVGGHSYTAPEPMIYSGLARVKDGDDVWIGPTDLRLYGVDAPEHDQKCEDTNGQKYSCGIVAADALGKLIEGKTVTCNVKGKDRHYRPLVICRLDDGTEINAAMIRSGVAVRYRYVKLYQPLVEEACQGQRGLWAGKFAWPGCVKKWGKQSNVKCEWVQSGQCSVTDRTP